MSLELFALNIRKGIKKMVFIFRSHFTVSPVKLTCTQILQIVIPPGHLVRFINTIEYINDIDRIGK